MTNKYTRFKKKEEKIYIFTLGNIDQRIQNFPESLCFRFVYLGQTKQAVEQQCKPGSVSSQCNCFGSRAITGSATENILSLSLPACSTAALHPLFLFLPLC